MIGERGVCVFAVRSTTMDLQPCCSMCIRMIHYYPWHVPLCKVSVCERSRGQERRGRVIEIERRKVWEEEKISPKQNYTCEFRQSRKTNLACSVLYEIARGLNMSCLIEYNLVCVVSFNKKQETNRPLITSPATPQQHDLPLIISRYWTSANKKPFIHQQK